MAAWIAARAASADAASLRGVDGRPAVSLPGEGGVMIVREDTSNNALTCFCRRVLTPRAPSQVQASASDDDRDLCMPTYLFQRLLEFTRPFYLSATVLHRAFPRLMMSVAASVASRAKSPAENSSEGSIMSI